MTIAYVGKGANSIVAGAGGRYNTATKTGVTIGNWLISLSWGANSSSVSTPVSAVTSGWTTGVVGTGQLFGVVCQNAAIFFKQATATTESLQVDYTSTDTYTEHCLIEVSASIGLLLDKIASGGGTTGTSGTAGPTGTTSNANAFIVAVAGALNNSYNTALFGSATSGFTPIYTEADASVNTPGDASYKAVTSAGAQSASWSWTNSSAWVGRLVAFIDAGGAALAATPAASATLSGTLTTSIRPAAALAAVATLTSALTTQKALNAAIAAVASTTAALTTQKPLNAGLTAVATATAALSTAISLAASPTAVATLSGTFAGSAAALASNLQAAATLTSALTTAKPVAAAMSGVATISASLTTGIALNAALGNLASVAAGLTTAIPLAAAPAGVATLTAALTTYTPVAATLAGVASVTAVLTTAIPLSAALQAIATASGSLTAPSAAALAADLVAAASLSASLTGGTPAAGFPGFEVDQRRPSPRRRLPEVHRVPVLQRALDKRLQRVRPKKDRAAARAKAIEFEAAALVLDGATEREIVPLLQEWEAQRPYIPPQLEEVPTLTIFISQIGFRIEQAQAAKATMDAVAKAKRQDEDALLALMLA